MSQPAVSIVIPTLNEERYLPFLLASLTQLGPVDVIVVDGNSSDDTVAVVSSYIDQFTDGASLRLIQPQKRGISLQRNTGARAARHEIIFFLDADIVIPSREIFLDLVREFSERGLAMANPRFMPHPLDEHGPLFWGYGLLYATQRLLLFLGKPIFTGACIITRRAIFELVGGFDETLILSEDADLTRKVFRIGTCGILRSKVANSTRRLKKIGAREAFAYLVQFPKLYMTGRVPNKLVEHYGFGDHR